MGRSPYLQTWHKMPTLTSSDVTPSALGQTLLPMSDSLRDEIHSESTHLRNPYLSRGRQMGKKKCSENIKPVPMADKKTEEAAHPPTGGKSSVEPNRLYLRRWYPA